MQKIINNPAEVVDEMTQGYIQAHPDLVAPTENERVLKYKDAPIADKVGIVTGGGSGHKPAFVGYVGRNMVDAVAMGGEYLKERGYDRIWGIGRHIQGSQIFDYWRDPWGNVVEHFTDSDLRQRAFVRRRSATG